jgi:hypothetical protein
MYMYMLVQVAYMYRKEMNSRNRAISQVGKEGGGEVRKIRQGERGLYPTGGGGGDGGEERQIREREREFFQPVGILATPVIPV